MKKPYCHNKNKLIECCEQNCNICDHFYKDDDSDIKTVQRLVNEVSIKESILRKDAEDNLRSHGVGDIYPFSEEDVQTEMRRILQMRYCNDPVIITLTQQLRKLYETNVPIYILDLSGVLHSVGGDIRPLYSKEFKQAVDNIKQKIAVHVVNNYSFLVKSLNDDTADEWKMSAAQIIFKRIHENNFNKKER